MKFIVLKDIAGKVKGTIYEPDTSEGVTVEYAMMLLLPEHFVELKTGKFNNDWEYTGEFRPPRANETFVDGSNSLYARTEDSDYTACYKHHILRKIKKSPTK